MLDLAENIEKLAEHRSDSDDDFELRKEDIEVSWKRKESILQNEVRDNLMRQILLKKYTPIVPSSKAISNYIEVDFLIALALMQQGLIDECDALDLARFLLGKKIDSYSRHSAKTIGLELEIDTPGNINSVADLHEYSQEVDLLQHLGMMINHDCLREIKLPKSVGPYDQAIALNILENLDIIQKDQFVGIHINISGIDNPEEVFSDIVLVHLLFNLSKHFGSDTTRQFGQTTNMPGHSRKSVITSDYGALPLVFPIKIKPGSIIEFRAIVQEWQGALMFSKSLFTLDTVIDTLGCYASERNNQSLSPKAQTWVDLKKEFFRLIDEQAELLDVQSLKNLEEYLQLLDLHLKHRRTDQKYNKITEELRTEYGPENYRSRTEFIDIQTERNNVAFQIVEMFRTNPTYWDQVESYLLEYTIKENKPARKAKIDELRDVNKQVDVDFVIYIRATIETIFERMCKNAFDNFGEIWSDMIALANVPAQEGQKSIQEQVELMLIQLRRSTNQKAVNEQ